MVQVKIRFISVIKMILEECKKDIFHLKELLRNIERRFKETSSDYIREQMQKYMSEHHCPTCKGHRLEKRESFCAHSRGPYK